MRLLAIWQHRISGSSGNGTTSVAKFNAGNSGFGTRALENLMLFYEPAFVTFFLAFYAFYLLATTASVKKWALLLASTLFYFWGEPVFVLVLLASTAIDYALSFYLDAATPLPTRRLALFAGVALNLTILVVYKYADFLTQNLNLALAPFGASISRCCISRCRSASLSSCSRR